MPPAHLYPHHLQKLREVNRSGTIFVHHINQVLREDTNEEEKRFLYCPNHVTASATSSWPQFKK